MSNPNIVSRFDEIYNSTNKAVLSLITTKCGNSADINDIFQDTYMELYKILIKRGANYITNEKALLFRIAKRKIAHHYSLLERLRIFVSTTTNNEDREEIELSDFDINAFLMEDYAVNKIMLENARKFIMSKSEDIKKAFYLFYDVGLSITEIADALCMSESNVKHKIYRTLKELQNLLK